MPDIITIIKIWRNSNRVEPISLDKYIKLVKKGWKIIVCFMAGMLLLACIYGVTLYKPNYKSEAVIYIKGAPPVSFLTKLSSTEQRWYNQLGLNDNPVITQMRVFLSDDIAQSTLDKLSESPFLKKLEGEKTNEELIKLLHKHFKLKNPPTTDIIKITFSWNQPDEAQRIAQAYLNSYIEFNINLNKNPVSQTKKYISSQLAKSSADLKELRDQTEKYRMSNGTVDIADEALSITNQISTIEDSVASINSQLQSEKGKSHVLAVKLGINTNKAIKAAALGQNNVIATLQQNLHDAEQKYSLLNAKYPPTNIQMKSLAANIREIKEEISEQMNTVIGEKALNKANSLISDSVRSKILDDLVASQSNVQALQSQKQALLGTLSELRRKQKVIPQKQNAMIDCLNESNINPM